MHKKSDQSVNEVGTPAKEGPDRNSGAEEPKVDGSVTEEGTAGGSVTEEAAQGAEKAHRSKKAKKEAQKAEAEESVEARLLRLQADFENFRKRTLREKKDQYTRANEDIIQELLPVLDHMELALSSAREHEASKALLDGFRLVHEQLLTALRKFNLSMIDVAVGAGFDPNVHEAISHIRSPDVGEGNIIVQVRKGYLLGDQLLRPAQVVVSSGAPEDAGSFAEDG